MFLLFSHLLMKLKSNLVDSGCSYLISPLTMGRLSHVGFGCVAFLLQPVILYTMLRATETIQGVKPALETNHPPF